MIGTLVSIDMSFQEGEILCENVQILPYPSEEM